MGSIFCDGACSGNGTARAYGGWAWAYWPGVAKGEPTAYGAQKLTGPRPTNQRAELTALLEAIRFAQKQLGKTLTIYTDSMYAINCTTKWGPSWSKKGWKRDSGEPLQNLDLIKPLVAAWNPTIPLVHVRGHQTGSGPAVHGNNWVDRAAVAAAKGEEIHTVASPTVLALEIPGPEEDSDTIQHIMAESMRPEKPEKLPKITKTLKAEKPKVLKQADLRTWF
jgi:ribonuclease HI